MTTPGKPSPTTLRRLLKDAEIIDLSILAQYIKQQTIQHPEIDLKRLKTFVDLQSEHQDKSIDTLDYELLLKIKAAAEEAEKNCEEMLSNNFFPYKPLPAALRAFVTKLKTFCVPPSAYVNEYSNVAYQLGCTDISEWELRYQVPEEVEEKEAKAIVSASNDPTPAENNEKEGFLLVSKKFTPEQKAELKQAQKSITAKLIETLKRDYNLLLTEAEFEKYLCPSNLRTDAAGNPYYRLCFDIHPLIEKILEAKQQEARKRFKKTDDYPLVIELAVVMDISDSTSEQIDAMKSSVVQLQKDLQEKYPNALIRIAIIAHRDYPDPLIVRPFTTADKIETFLKTLQAGGGGDLAENTEEALDQVRYLDWTDFKTTNQQLSRLVVVMGSSPPHGVPKAVYDRNGDFYSDNFPIKHKNPKGLYWEETVKAIMKELGPSIHTITCLEKTYEAKNEPKKEPSILDSISNLFSGKKKAKETTSTPKPPKLNKTAHQIHKEMAKLGNGTNNVLEDLNKLRKCVVEQVAVDIANDNKYRASKGIASPTLNLSHVVNPQGLSEAKTPATITSAGKTKDKPLTSPKAALITTAGTAPSVVLPEVKIPNPSTETTPGNSVEAETPLSPKVTVSAAANNSQLIDMLKAMFPTPTESPNGPRPRYVKRTRRADHAHITAAKVEAAPTPAETLAQAWEVEAKHEEKSSGVDLVALRQQLADLQRSKIDPRAATKLQAEINEKAAREYIESDKDLKAYYTAFRKQFQALWIACLVISSGIVHNDQRTKLGTAATVIDELAKSFPGASLLAAILTSSVRVVDERSKAIFVKKIIAFFAGLKEALELIDLLALKLTLAQQDVLKAKGIITTKEGFVHNLKEKFIKAKRWALVDTIDTPVKQLAADQLAGVVKAICEETLGINKDDYCKEADLPKVFGCVCPTVDYASVRLDGFASNKPASALNTAAVMTPSPAPSPGLAHDASASPSLATVMQELAAQREKLEGVNRQVASVDKRVATVESNMDGSSSGGSQLLVTKSPLHAGGGSLLEMQQELAVQRQQITELTGIVGAAANTIDPTKKGAAATDDSARTKLLAFVPNYRPH